MSNQPILTPDPEMPAPPAAEQRPYHAEYHGISLDDPYHWLKDPGYPKVEDADVLSYLRAENAYFESWMGVRQKGVDALFAEMKARLKEDDASVPAKDGDWLYWWAFETGGQYRKWWRRRVEGGADELILDEPALAGAHEYFRLGAAAVSPDGRLIAYAVDDDGSERFKLRIRDIAGQVDIAEVSTETLGSPVWAADGGALAYVVVTDAWRPYRVMLHRLGSGTPDEVLYEEADPGFFVGIGRTQDRRWLTVTAADHVTSEVRLLPLAVLDAVPVLVSPRQTGREYEVEGDGDRLIIRTNDTHVNFRLAVADPASPGEWAELIAGSDEVYIRGVTAFRDGLVLTERVDGLDHIRIIARDGGEHRVAFPEASYTAGLGENAEYGAETLRLGYQSMVTPPTVFNYDPRARALTTLKVQQIPSGYDPARFETRRLMAPARDGTMIPVSIVLKRGEAAQRVHLYGYGAYGVAIPPGFSTSRLSLVERGVAFAIAHVRGGDDLGYRWYLDGKLEKRANTYTDFVDAARHLAREGYGTEGISASGGSAGGNLMGVAANSDPGQWRAIVAHVPFVDMLNTMLDESLPLTPMEWPEWGDPIRDAAAFQRIASFSPYENVRAQDYPPMLVTAGLNDPRVTYWEPAKWVARLRATKTDANLVLLKTNMGAGHGGKSGRFEALRETAEEYAFVLAAFGINAAA